MLRLHAPVALALAFGLGGPTGCGGGDSSDGGTETDGSTGASNADSEVPGSRSGGDDGGVSLTFTGSPPDDDGGVDDGKADDEDSGQADSATTAADTGTDGGGTDPTGDTDRTDGGSTGDTGSGLPDGAACCEAQAGPGCGGTSVESCVCTTDDFCCTQVWDVVCTVQVVTLGCASCAGIGGGGDCCAANGTPGCDDDAVEACVCDQDFVCCTEDWDMLCVDAVTARGCGACP